jgi:hypothetical protein
VGGPREHRILRFTQAPHELGDSSHCSGMLIDGGSSWKGLCGNTFTFLFLH